MSEPEPEAAPDVGQAPAAKPGPDVDPLSIVYGRATVSTPTAAERVLAGATIDWLIGFPPVSRPKTLCDRYPHVANRLAATWSDKAASLRSVELLAADPRWGSVGYPAIVQGELQCLLAHLSGTG